MDFLQEAKKNQSMMISYRRYLHENAEIGFDLPKTVAFVEKQLRLFGYETKRLGGGVVCMCGTGSKTLLLRADMDALPQTELSGLPFACKGNACHSCGHDMHTAMLLGAAKILKENESLLKGQVKFMFQPAEEILQGAAKMVEEGVLDNPKVDAAMAIHLTTDPAGHKDSSAGTLEYCTAAALASADAFEITIKGKETHGSMPEDGVSALSIAVNAVVALQQVIPQEIDSNDPAVMTICAFNSGTTTNIVPGEAIIKGSLRTYDYQTRAYLKKRLIEIPQKMAQLWCGDAKTEFIMEVEPNINDENLTRQMVEHCQDIMRSIKIVKPLRNSEDFAAIGKHVPIFYGFLGADGGKTGEHYAMHNPHILFDEEAMPYGTAAFCSCAINWLDGNEVAKEKTL